MFLLDCTVRQCFSDLARLLVQLGLLWLVQTIDQLTVKMAGSVCFDQKGGKFKPCFRKKLNAKDFK